MVLQKYSASGNDFLIFHVFRKTDFSQLARTMCDRHEGIGADGLIVLLPHETCDLEWLFYNSDGSAAEMCGNGTRAAALYAYNNNLTENSLSLMTAAGKIELEIEPDNVVGSTLTEPEIIERSIQESGYNWWLINTGVPHLVAPTHSLSSLDRETLSELRHRYNANVNLYEITENSVLVRTYERGVEAETLACGTGMAAVFVRGLEEKALQSPTTMQPASGEKLQFEMRESNIFFKGKTKKICDSIAPFPQKTA